MELAEVLADIAMDIASRTELLIELAGGTELEVQIEIRQPKKLEVLLIASVVGIPLKVRLLYSI